MVIKGVFFCRENWTWVIKIQKMDNPLFWVRIESGFGKRNQTNTSYQSPSLSSASKVKKSKDKQEKFQWHKRKPSGAVEYKNYLSTLLQYAKNNRTKTSV